MTRAFLRHVLLLALALAPASARAGGGAADHLARARAAHDRGDFAAARDELLAAYNISHKPELLFALGQVEFNLDHYREAIAYYEQFLATHPPAEQAKLAQQALTTARIVLERTPPATTPSPAPPPEPRPAPPPPPPHREFDHADVALAASGGAVLVAAGALFVHGSLSASDRSGSLSAYADRVDRAHLERNIAIASTVVGTAAITTALLRWRFHLVETTVTVEASSSGATVTLGRPL